MNADQVFMAYEPQVSEREECAMAYWIWYPGDFEIHHALLVNCRREERSSHWPGMWRQDDCWKSVRFRRMAVLEKPEKIRVQCIGVGSVSVDGVKHPIDVNIPLEPGAHEVFVDVAMPYGLPCAFVDGDVFESGEGWMADQILPRDAGEVAQRAGGG